mmetsp:Transcript_108720/g.351003  ORF Transcript_108720/g.351003 Transcript_108720/m.351003 type:complete len:251 (+) Transcript_108720:83-835(+)
MWMVTHLVAAPILVVCSTSASWAWITFAVIAEQLAVVFLFELMVLYCIALLPSAAHERRCVRSLFCGRVMTFSVWTLIFVFADFVGNMRPVKIEGCGYWCGALLFSAWLAKEMQALDAARSLSEGGRCTVGRQAAAAILICRNSFSKSCCPLGGVSMPESWCCASPGSLVGSKSQAAAKPSKCEASEGGQDDASTRLYGILSSKSCCKRCRCQGARAAHRSNRALTAARRWPTEHLSVERMRVVGSTRSL